MDTTTTEENKTMNIEFAEYSRCPHCKRKTAGKEDFYSLVDGETIVKTCIKCRKESYNAYKKKHPSTRIKNDYDKTKDYTEEYQNHLRCPTCKRKKNGEEDFKNIRSGRITKGCNECKSKIYQSYKKKHRKTMVKRVHLKDKVKLLKDLLSKIDKAQIETLIEKHPQQKVLRAIMV